MGIACGVCIDNPGLRGGTSSEPTCVKDSLLGLKLH